MDIAADFEQPEAGEGSVRRRDVVIVGAGFGGLACARRLGRDTDLSVTVVDRENHHLFQPLLYQVATAALSPAEIAEPIRRILWRHRNVEVLMGSVEAVDAGRRTVRLADGTVIGYRRLVLATGSAFDYLGHPEWAEHAPGLKSLADARLIRNRVLGNFEKAEASPDAKVRDRLTTMVVVGGGPTGVEVAGALAELARLTLAREFRHVDPRQARVFLVEAGPRLLSGFPEGLSDYARRSLEARGVTVMTDSPVEDITAEGVTLAGERLPAGLVVWGAGVRVEKVADWLGVEPADRSGRVAVAGDLSVPGRPGVHVAGDAAFLEEDGRPLPGLAQVAKQQGEYLGRVLPGLLADATEPEPFRFRDRGNTAVIGRNAAVFDFGGRHLEGRLAWLLWAVVHVYLLVGRQNRVTVAIHWLWRYFTHHRSARIIR